MAREEEETHHVATASHPYIYIFYWLCPSYHITGPSPLKVCKTPILSKGSPNILASPLAPMVHAVHVFYPPLWHQWHMWSVCPSFAFGTDMVFRHLKQQNLSTRDDFMHGSINIFFPFLATTEADVPLVNNVIISRRLIQWFRHLEH